MNGESFRIFELVRQPILIAFVDLNSKDKKIFRESVNLVDNVLKEVAPAFFHGLVVTYADNNLYNRHRKMLGLTHNKVPAISINNNEQRVLPYPDDAPMTADALKKWLGKFVKGQLESKSSGFGSIIDAEIKYMLSNLKMLTRYIFVEEAFEEGTDAFVLLYTSSVEDNN